MGLAPFSKLEWGAINLLFKRIFILVTFLFTVNAEAMHHENSHKFSDCDGKVANYYVSKLIAGGTVKGFLKDSKKSNFKI